MDAQKIVQVVELIKSAENGTRTAEFSRSSIASAMEDIRDHVQAAEFAAACLRQAIVVGGVCVKRVSPKTGKNDDRTSNIKRLLSGAHRDAYPACKTPLILKTTGKGTTRTVTVSWGKERAVLEGRNAFIARLGKLLETCNCTGVESEGISEKILALYDREQERALDNQAQADALVAQVLVLQAPAALKSAAEAMAAVTATAREAYLALHGKEPSVKELQAALKEACGM